MESQNIVVMGKNMHYLTEGKGKTLLFLHGVPGTSDMWIPIMSLVSSQAQCIAVDLIGMGKSDKPKLDYSIDDHVLFLKGFIDSLGLDYFTLVLNGWGSIVGLEYARQYPDKIAGLVFTEAYLRLEKDHQNISLFFEKLKQLEKNESEKLKMMLTHAFWKTLEDNPYVNPNSPVIPVIENYSAWLEQAPNKKLLLYGGSGFLTTRAAANWAIKTLPNITAVDLGIEATTLSGVMAQKFSEALLGWL
ncbi:MAG TPA: alpha/beta fold hydrolase [Gammaproteobacteria bacterium]|nr:alpha/beta fold hydrolase [Gammaproteobacteria bacterium]